MKPKKLIIIYAFISALLLVACHRQKDVPAVSPHVSPLVAKDISCNNVNAFAEDEHGMIWMGTFRGLNKFDGHQFYQYFYGEDSTGLPDNQVRDLLVDSRKRMWVATNNGVCLHSEMDNFPRVPVMGGCTNCNNLFIDSKGSVCLTTNSTICSYNEATRRFEVLISSTRLRNQRVLKAMSDLQDRIWALTLGGIYVFSRQGRPLYQIPLGDAASSALFSNFFIDKRGKLWFSAFLRHDRWLDTHTLKFIPTPSCLRGLGDILAVAPYKKNQLVVSCSKGIFVYDALAQQVFSLDSVNGRLRDPSFRPLKIMTDSKGNVWMGEPDEGFRVGYAQTRMFNRDNRFEELLGRQPVTSVAADKRGNVWIASKKNGLVVYHLPSQSLRQIPTEFAPYYVFADRADHIWISSGKGVAEYAYDGQKLRQLRRFQTPLMLAATEDRTGNIWLAGNSSSLLCFPKNKAPITACPVSQSPVSFIPAVLTTIDGNVLSAAYLETVYQTNPRTRQTSRLPISEADWRACIRRPNFVPSFLFQDKLEDLWIGTVGNGVLHYDTRTRKLTQIEGLSCSDVSSAEEDNFGNVWISSMYGLNKYNRDLGRVVQYFESDGIGGNQFYDRASCKLADGTLVFGGTHGITVFDPADVVYDDTVPVVFQALLVNNQLVKAHKGGIIEKKIEDSPAIHLNYRENNFTIVYNTVDYKEYETAHYFYKLEGSDKIWLDARNNHEATYSNLPPGKYLFRVKVANNLREKPLAEASIPIEITPAPWNSLWARLFYVAALVSLLLFLYRSRMRSMRDKMRMQFMTNLSHEFRTPLTMIEGPISLLANSNNLRGNESRMIEVAEHSIQRMLRLVNQMLDFGKLEQDTLKLKVQRVDIVKGLNDLCDLFLFHAREKGITLHRQGLEGCVLTWVDTDKLDKIMSNLLNNAIKFTPRGGNIEVGLEIKDKEILIKVADTGKGIPNEQTEKIFKLYYQIDSRRADAPTGTGIGLYYARKLALLHHGSLVAGNRTDGQGAVFTLTLPTNDGAYAEEERVRPEAGQEKRYPILKEQKVQKAAVEIPMPGDEERPVILVVDDDPDIVNYLSILLSPRYRVVYRFNAEEALTALEKEEPNLILCDVVMPGWDGYEFCNKVKSDSRFCHIPIILVTAKADIQHQIEGLEKGADAYLAKPFDPKLMMALIKSQLDNREKVRALLNRSTSPNKPIEEALAPQDQLFITRLYKVMEAEIMNSELDVNYVAQELGMSRTKFYYKMKGLTGSTPGAFFRTYKLNCAAEYLREGKYNISEISNMTGFSSLSFFSTCFKKQFGVPPSEFS